MLLWVDPGGSCVCCTVIDINLNTSPLFVVVVVTVSLRESDVAQAGLTLGVAKEL